MGGVARQFPSVYIMIAETASKEILSQPPLMGPGCGIEMPARCWVLRHAGQIDPLQSHDIARQHAVIGEYFT